MLTWWSPLIETDTNFAPFQVLKASDIFTVWPPLGSSYHSQRRLFHLNIISSFQHLNRYEWSNSFLPICVLDFASFLNLLKSNFRECSVFDHYLLVLNALIALSLFKFYYIVFETHIFLFQFVGFYNGVTIESFKYLQFRIHLKELTQQTQSPIHINFSIIFIILSHTAPSVRIIRYKFWYFHRYFFFL